MIKFLFVLLLCAFTYGPAQIPEGAEIGYDYARALKSGTSVSAVQAKLGRAGVVVANSEDRDKNISTTYVWASKDESLVVTFVNGLLQKKEYRGKGGKVSRIDADTIPRGHVGDGNIGSPIQDYTGRGANDAVSRARSQ